MSQDVFAEEWRACLREHFMDVIRAGDKLTEKSLLTVMDEVGFTDSDLRELRVLATLHVDDVADDFVPDLEALRSEGEPMLHAVALPETMLESESVEEVEPEVDDSLEEIQLEDVEADMSETSVEEDEDNPQQLSLF